MLFKSLRYKHYVFAYKTCCMVRDTVLLRETTLDLSRYRAAQSELLGQFRLIGDRASDVSGGRICLTQNAYAEI